MDETPANDNLSTEEVRERISQLREPDVLKLLALARARLYKSGDVVPMEELLSESVSRILSGRRNWRRNMDTVPFILAISSIPQLGGSPSESVPGAHWQASPPAESQRCPRTQFSFNTVCP